MTRLRPITIDKSNPFLGESCALCKHPFAPGEEIVICPEDATRHHTYCWQANNNHCTALGCNGQGAIVAVSNATPETHSIGRPRVTPSSSKVRTLPTRSFHMAQSCLLIAIAISILIFAFSCFGLWAIADYVMIEILNWQYRPIFDSLLPLIPLLI